ncbi:unnamed protein product [Cylicocyclus nassatus]|uniref:Uncharacterized protein n=1 Tax=Cylicocyclus nassatus TaxID=53992 RepID=A0AA36GQ26_CYLNA|nr:unnamed protein product [Cylicocyclus nassatus]
MKGGKPSVSSGGGNGGGGGGGDSGISGISTCGERCSERTRLLLAIGAAVVVGFAFYAYCRKRRSRRRSGHY